MLLVIAIVFIFSALAFYTVGVWAERMGGKLRWWHAIVFWIGVACDSTGTGAMGTLAGGLFANTFHGITAMAAIILMLIHAVWATIVLARKNEKMIRRFHRFSLFVWCVWLVPMIGGMVLGSAVWGRARPSRSGSAPPPCRPVVLRQGTPDDRRGGHAGPPA